MNPEASRSALHDLLAKRLEGTPGTDWESLREGKADLEAVRASLPEVTRAVGKRALIGSFKDRAGASLEGVWGTLPVGDWRCDDAARVLLLAGASDETGDPYRSLFTTYDLGDTETRVATLRALNFVRKADPAPGIDMVLDAGRTYLTQLMTAAWCGNPFTAFNLNDHDYRKAVLKAFFCDIPVEGFLRLEERADAELSQSLWEYMEERLAAGRTVPLALWSVAALHPRPGLVARLIGNLEHPSGPERIVAARALGRAGDARAKSFLAERHERESDPEVKAALEQAQAVLEEA